MSPSGEVIPYNYSIGYSAVKGMDVLGSFVSSCQKAEIKTGFYYTVVNNNWFNVDDGLVSKISYDTVTDVLICFLIIQIQNRTLAPGQVNITQETYNNIVLQQLGEIWSRYGTLNEIWFDGGLVSH